MQHVDRELKIAINNVYRDFLSKVRMRCTTFCGREMPALWPVREVSLEAIKLERAGLLEASVRRVSLAVALRGAIREMQRKLALPSQALWFTFQTG